MQFLFLLRQSWSIQSFTELINFWPLPCKCHAGWFDLLARNVVFTVRVFKSFSYFLRGDVISVCFVGSGKEYDELYLRRTRSLHSLQSDLSVGLSLLTLMQDLLNTNVRGCTHVDHFRFFQFSGDWNRSKYVKMCRQIRRKCRVLRCGSFCSVMIFLFLCLTLLDGNSLKLAIWSWWWYIDMHGCKCLCFIF